MNASTADRITRDVILDLLPAVRGGVASADSRRLVEDYLAQDPEFAARAAVLPAPSAGMEMEALKRTRRHVHAASWAMALGIFFTMLPFSFLVNDEGAMRFVFSGQPAFQMILLAIGVVAWIAYFRHRNKLGA
jgi:hypothetical protein